MPSKQKSKKKTRSGLVKRQAQKRGLPPGTLVHVGDRKIDQVRIAVMDYDENRFDERQLDRIENAYAYKASPTVTWLNIDGLLDIYLSSISNRMNAVMKVLTLVATMFIPLTFVAGVYGMNFEHMPELRWKYAYAGFWGIIVVMVVCMMIYFKRKKW